MKRHWLLSVAISAVAVLSIFTTSRLAWAHGHVDVGKYELVIGFHNEPAYQGEPNGLDLFVTDTESSERVNGLQETLQVEIIFGSARRELDIRPQWGQDGAYTADVLPTEAGDYTWRIWGTIEDTPVDVSMTSSPDTFSSVHPKTDVSFPGAEPASVTLQAEAASAARAAQTALIVAVVGVVLGLAGIAIGFMGRRNVA